MLRKSNFLMLGAVVAMATSVVMVSCGEGDDSGNGNEPPREEGGSGGDGFVVGGTGGDPEPVEGGSGGDPEPEMGGTGGDGDPEPVVGGTGGDPEPEPVVGGNGGNGNGENPPSCDEGTDDERCIAACEELVVCAVSDNFCPDFDLDNEPTLRDECAAECADINIRNVFYGGVCSQDTCEQKFAVVGAFNNENPNRLPSAQVCVEPPPFDPQAFVNETCSPCHIGGGTSEGLALDDLDALVGVASNFMGVPQITAGDHENSYIWRKMNGMQIIGGRMPQGAQAVSPDDLAAFAAWIDSLVD